ncbi:MAG: isovaleryl-CoA dehydrogenase [Thermoanaerobaculia bacterium]
MESGKTHEVSNQTPPLAGYDLFATDRALRDAVVREGAGWAEQKLHLAGTELGAPEQRELGRLANQHPPILRAFDSRGNRIDQVEFHPAWHELLGGITRRGLHTGPWSEPQAGAHVARAAEYLMQAQVEAGTLCPTTMTYGAVPALRSAPASVLAWLPTLFSREHDPRDIPFEQKRGGMIGMGMTEKQGGSDVRSNRTAAAPETGGAYRLTGHKWFFSAPMCDAHLVLANAPGGLSCFFVPRFTPDGKKNPIEIQRLKDKVGNRSNASSEVELRDAWGVLVGGEGRGIPTILEMGTYTRLDCTIGSAGGMRQALVQALHHAAHRQTFGKRLLDHPLMKNVLADLALESEAATALALRLARTFDSSDASEGALRRVMTPAGKYWVCKRAPELAAEAMEVLGGNGYVEEGVLGRLYREMPVNSIWEGSGNVMCLDVLRALGKTPHALEILMAELEPARGRLRAFDQFLDELGSELTDVDRVEARSRRLTQDLALALQASLLVRFAPDFVAEAFCRSRLSQDWGASFGTLPRDVDFDGILERAWPT